MKLCQERGYINTRETYQSYKKFIFLKIFLKLNGTLGENICWI